MGKEGHTFFEDALSSLLTPPITICRATSRQASLSGMNNGSASGGTIAPNTLKVGELCLHVPVRYTTQICSDVVRDTRWWVTKNGNVQGQHHLVENFLNEFVRFIVP
jgi:hypothetical protein